MTALRSGCYLEGHGDAFFPSQVSWSKVQVASLEHLLEGELLPWLLLPPEMGESTVGSRVIHSNRSCRQIPSSIWHCSVLFPAFKEAHFWKREKYLSPFLPIPCPTSIFQAACACLRGAALCPHVHVGMCMCMYIYVHLAHPPHRYGRVSACTHLCKATFLWVVQIGTLTYISLELWKKE